MKYLFYALGALLFSWLFAQLLIKIAESFRELGSIMSPLM